MGHHDINGEAAYDFFGYSMSLSSDGKNLRVGQGLSVRSREINRPDESQAASQLMSPPSYSITTIWHLVVSMIKSDLKKEMLLASLIAKTLTHSTDALEETFPKSARCSPTPWWWRWFSWGWSSSEINLLAKFPNNNSSSSANWIYCISLYSMVVSVVVDYNNTYTVASCHQRPSTGSHHQTTRWMVCRPIWPGWVLGR